MAAIFWQARFSNFLLYLKKLTFLNNYILIVSGFIYRFWLFLSHIWRFCNISDKSYYPRWRLLGNDGVISKSSFDVSVVRKQSIHPSINPPSFIIITLHL